MASEKKLKAGALRVERGNIAMCLEPEWVCGGWGASELWACVGKSYHMTTTLGRGYWKCIDVDPVNLTATYVAEGDERGGRRTYVINAEQIKRCHEEQSSENMQLDRDLAEEAAKQHFWQRAGQGLATTQEPSLLKAWYTLLGENNFQKLKSILETTQDIAKIINRSNGACTTYPSVQLKRLSKELKVLLGNTPEKMFDTQELTTFERLMYGSVFGALIGDAAGGVLEFMGRKPTKDEVQIAMDMPGGGVFNLAPGQFTDDGEMTVVLLNSLASSDGSYLLNQVAKAYCGWARSKPFDIGMATSSALIEDPYDESSDALEIKVERQAAKYNSESKANGSLMRATPLGVIATSLSLEDAIEVARKDARLTHPNETCQHATVAYVLAMRHLILNPGDAKGAFATAVAYAREYSLEVTEWLELVANRKPEPTYPLAGFVKHAFSNAFYHLRLGSIYEDAIAQTLERGGDTDTNACIVGGLIGALHGVDKIPQAMLGKLVSCDTGKGQPRPDWVTVKGVLPNLRKLNVVLLN
jgi:ADP-ribosyl-[dinitrogen reductase] hydrolase